MDSKLTLKLNQKIIEKAKQYAADKKLSLSRLIENYLSSLTSEPIDDTEISPFVKSLSSKIEIPVDHDYRVDYHGYLDQKHR